MTVLATVVALTGCATTAEPHDPFQGFNRAMFSFNDTIDQVALKPVATVYRDTLPMFAQIAVGNFFGNLGDVWTAVNNFLQGKMADGATDVMRVIVNSTFGLGGLIDIGSDAGMPKHKEDFGQTLGVWGVPSGPYVVLPFLGPTTLRDTVALPLDVQGDIWGYTSPAHVRNAGTLLRVIDQRSVVLDATNLIEDAALDRYEFIRDGFLQRRENNVNDGAYRKSLDDDDPRSSAPILPVHDTHYSFASLQNASPAIDAVASTPTVEQPGSGAGRIPERRHLQQEIQTSDTMTPSVSSNDIQPVSSITNE